MFQIVALLATLAVVANAEYSFNDESISGCSFLHAPFCGPNHWSNSYAECSAAGGSPIDISAANVVHSNSFPGPLITVHDGGCEAVLSDILYFYETLTMDFTDACAEKIVALYNSHHYYLETVNFHSPSQHTFGSGFYAADAEMVFYSNETDTYVNINVNFDLSQSTVPGNSNSFFDDLRENFYSTNASVYNPFDLTPGSNAMFYYEGSATAPPCTTGVAQFVYAKPVTISQWDVNLIRGNDGTGAIGDLEQSAAVTNADGGNNRPVQELGNRTITYFYSEVIETPAPSSAPTLWPTADPTTYQERAADPAPVPELARTNPQKVNLGVILSSLSLGCSGLVLLALTWILYTYGNTSPEAIKAAADRRRGINRDGSSTHSGKDKVPEYTEDAIELSNEK